MRESECNTIYEYYCTLESQPSGRRYKFFLSTLQHCSSPFYCTSYIRNECTVYSFFPVIKAGGGELEKMDGEFFLIDGEFNKLSI